MRAYLLDLRDSLADMIALELAKSQKYGYGYGYDDCLQWFETATTDREYMSFVLNIWKAHGRTESRAQGRH